MAESTLRAYLKEIDDLIEHNQLDEAIAHCRHILETYPKHLDTYRLLGKAYLEAKRYGDAADIFQRVLSVVPDDFVSHVGMSIVREDEGNTDAAIWHMERAFETNPANPAIQHELRRLIGRRDGIEPHKVRLTRGALARMYAHGELYPQAVAELRAALQEDPERADLLVVLAEMSWRTGQRSEAVEVCNRIVSKLPYCREANRILAAAYQASGRNDQAAAFHRRLANLDPYFAFVESAMADPQTVDPGSVRIERLIWEGRQAAAARQPVWASSLGVDLATPPEVPAMQPTVPLSGPIPSWLQDLGVEGQEAGKAPEEMTARAQAPAIARPAAAPAQPEDGIPDWMREAGWQPATGQAAEGPVSFSDEDLAALERGKLAPETPAEGELAPGEIPEWLKAVAPKEITEAASAAGAVPLSEAEVPAGEEGGPLPAWLQDISAEAAVTLPDDTGNVLGGWAPTPLEPDFGLEAERPEEEVPEAIGADVSPLGDGKGVPTWIEESAPGATDTIVAWLGDRPGRERSPAPEELPQWMREPIAEEAEPAPEKMPAEPSEPSIPAWLSGVAEAAAQQEPVLPEEVPWLQQAQVDEEAEAAAAPEWVSDQDYEVGEAMPAAQREPPEWLRGIVEPGLGRPGEPSAAKEPPQWLREAIEPVAGRKVGPEEPEPDWLKGLAEPELATPARPAEGPPPTWLEALREGLAEPSRSMPEEADWLRGIAEPEAAPAAEPEEELRAREWLESLSQPEPVPSEEQAETPAWLAGPEIGTPEAEVEAPRPEAEMIEKPGMAVPAEAAAEEDVLQWLETLAASQEAAKAEVPLEPYAGAPAAPIVEERALPEEPAEGLEWLERLAAERGIEAPFEQPAPAPSPAAAAAPEWLRAPTAPTPSEEAEEAVPSWLEGLPSPDTAGPAWPPPTQPRPAVKPAEPPAPLEPEPEVAVPSAVEPEAEAPVWMRAPIIEPPTTPLQAPDWLLAAAKAETPEPEAAPAQPAAIEQAAAVPVEVPDWLQEVTKEEAEAEAPAAPPAVERIPTGLLEVPEWLRAAAAEELPPEVPPTPPPEERIPTGLLEMPEWLRAAAAEELPAEVPPTPPAEEWIPAGLPEVPEWLQAAAAEEPTAAAPEPAAIRRPQEPAPEPIQETSALEVPEWLTSTVAPQPQPEQPIPPRAAEEPLRTLEAELSRSMPEWLRPPSEAVPPPSAPATAPAVLTPVPRPAMAIPMAAITPPPAPTPMIPMAAVTPPPSIPPGAAPTPAAPSVPTPAPPPVVEPAPAQPAPPGRPGVPGVSEVLERARRALGAGEIDKAAKDYGSLIRKKREIPSVIDDLRAALARDASLAPFWQILGDAYMKMDMLPEAIEAYRRGLEAV